MSTWKRNTIRVLIITTWCAVGIGSVVLLAAAIKKKNQQVCKGYEIDISGADKQMFIDKKKIEDILFNGERAAGKPVSEFDLLAMEKTLIANVWIRNAQLFFDNDGELQVKVEEREPIARVFTAGGKTFYIDSSGERLPLSENQVAHLLVFTNFPVEKGKLRKADSMLMRDMVNMSMYINKDEFWSAQVEQIDITSNRTFEMIPLVGNHLVSFGGADDMRGKFSRLQVFYKQVMSKTGFDHYEKLDLQYAGQIVATRKAAPISKQDSLLAVEKVKEMIAEAHQIQPDTLAQARVRPIEKADINEQTLRNYDLLPMDADSALSETPKNPDPVKTVFENSSKQNSKKPIVKTGEKKQEVKPKAQMQKRGF